jgi:hypothetical protein
VNDGFGALQCAARALDRRFAGHSAGSTKLLQTGRNNLSQVRLLVAIGDLDRLFKLAVLERTGNLRRKFARLFAGGGEVQVTVDHNGQRPDRLDEQEDGYRACQPPHVLPQSKRAEADCLLFLEK